MGQLVFQATAGGQVALVGPNPSSNFSLNVPAVNGNLVTTGDTGTVTNTMLASSAYTAPGTIGSGTPNTGAFTTLSASSTVSGTGFSTYLASPPAIGGTSPSTGKFTSITNTGLTSGYVVYATTGGLETGSANLTVGGNGQLVVNAASGQGTPLYLTSTDASANVQTIFAGVRTFQVGTGNSGSGFANALYFYDGTAGAERMRITSGGSVLIGNTTNITNGSLMLNGQAYLGYGYYNFASSDFVLTVAYGTTVAQGISFGTSATSGTQTACRFLQNNSVVGSITTTNTATLYNISSDVRLKENIVDSPSALPLINSVKVRSFDFKSDGSHTEFGLIAQEFYKVAPECVSKGDDGEEIE